jgi:uncharacterized protein DUF4258
MDIAAIKRGVRSSDYFYSQHALAEREAEGLTFGQIRDAILNGRILEQYPDTGRGESCLVAGFAGGLPIHAVCGWLGSRIVIITVYIPRAPKFADPWTRGDKDGG